MPVSFIEPAYLWLLLLLVPLWTLALADPRRLPRWRRWVSLGLRTLILTVLVLVLAGAQILWQSSRTTTVFVIDHSDSIAPSMRAQADHYVETALNHMPPGDQASVVVFGRDALVEQPPSQRRDFTRTTVTPPSEHTYIERAL